MTENLGFEWKSVIRLGILGGTFDPVHNGHLAAARVAADACDLDRLLFIPARKPPHKTDANISPSMHRYLMAVLATVDTERFVVSRVELDREGPSYTIHTIRQLKELTGQDTEIFLVLGADMVLDIVNWYEPDAIMQEARVIGVSRPGFDLQNMEQKLGQKRSQRIEIVPADTPDISGTEIRKRTRKGNAITDAVPDAVRAYIEAAQLYT
ncbi:MAG: nicotinate-nucleotide adenylyltransferase [Armatimonadota bacterium]